MTVPPLQDVASRLRTALAGQYRVGDLLGQGGMGSVYRAHDEALDRPVAIKVVSPDVAASAELRQRFVQESRTVARLRHPNIVAVYAAGEVDGLLYFVMEYVPGESLRERLTREGALGEAAAVPILRDLALALDYAHTAGLVHRDVKPENVLLDRDTGRAMLTDFGVARALQGSLELTGAGLVLGSPRYMSPEQASGEGTLDGRSDLYSLGLIGVELLTGVPAVTAPTAAAVLVKHLTEQVTPLAQSAPRTSPAVAAAIDRLLRKAPDERWARGRDFVAALTGEAVSGASFERSPSGTPSAAIRGTAGTGRRSRGKLVASVAAVGAVAAAAFALLRAPADAQARDWLVAPFEVQGPDRSLDWLREGGLNMLTLSLAQWRDLHVVEYERTLDLLRDEQLEDARRIGLEDAQRLARRAGAGRVVLGQLTLAGDSLIATASLFDARSGTITERARVAALRTADPRGVFERLAGDLLNFVGAPQVPIDLAQQTTTSLDAYRLYLEGLRALNSWRLEAADSAFTKAIQRDSTFALAYYRRSLGQGWIGRLDSTRLRDADLAVQFASRLPARQQEIVRGHAELTRGFMHVTFGQEAPAQQAFLASRARLANLVAVDSLDAEAWYALADASYHLVWNTPFARSPDSTAKYLDESLHGFRRTIALDSTFHLAYQHLVDVYNQVASPQSYAVLAGDHIVPGGSPANERRLGTSVQVAAMRQAARERAREAALGWIAADPDASQARRALVDNLVGAGMPDSAIGVLQAAMARSTTNDPSFPWRVLAIKARQLTPGVGREYSDLLARTSVDSLRRLGVAERYMALSNGVAVGGLTGRTSLVTAAANTLAKTDSLLPSVPQVPTRLIALWASATTRAAMGVPSTLEERQQLNAAVTVLSQLPPARRDRISSYMMYLATRDSTHARLTLSTLAAQGDSAAYPELEALLALQRGDTATAQRLTRAFPSLDTMRTAPIGTTGMRMVGRALVLAELGNPRRAVDLLELIDPARFVGSEGVESTWPVYVRQFALRGRLYEQLGERDKAIAAYERFLALWADADAPVQPQLRDAREAIARLRDAARTSGPASATSRSR